MRLSYRLLNVFARPGDPFSGNPLCVFEDGSRLSEEQMQGLARQFNLSETTFLQPAVDGADAAVRIFTASYEMPFAGHPTLGTAHVVRALRLGGDAVRLSMPAGIIPVRSQDDSWTLTANSGEVLHTYDRAGVAEAVGLAAGDLVDPVQVVSTGSPQVIAQAASVDAVRRARANPALFAGHAGIGAGEGETLVYVWSPAGEGRLEARALISDGQSVAEDAATGSACSNLGAWLAAQGRSGEWEVSQGAQVQRPSTLHLSVGDDRTVRVGGLVHDVGVGVVEL